MQEENKILNDEELEKVTGGITGDVYDTSLIKVGDWILNYQDELSFLEYRYKVVKVHEKYCKVATYKRLYSGNPEDIHGPYVVYFIWYETFSKNYQRCDAPDSTFTAI